MNAYAITISLFLAIISYVDIGRSASPLRVRTELALIAAIRNSSISQVLLNDHIRLTAEAWPVAEVFRSTDFSIVGDFNYPIMDLSFLERKIRLAPGVTFIFKQVEIRNVRQRAGFDVDLFSESPGALVGYEDVVYFSFSCVPLRVLAGILPMMPKLQGDENLVQDISFGLQTWCRNGSILATCYSSEEHLLTVNFARGLVLQEGLVGLSSGGGYGMYGRNVVFVCDSPVNDECGRSMGYDYCVRNKIQSMYEQDRTWELLLEAASGSSGASGGGSSMGGRRQSGAVVAAGVASAATALVAVAVVFVLLYRRRRQHNLAGRAGGGLEGIESAPISSSSCTNPQPSSSSPPTTTISPTTTATVSMTIATSTTASTTALTTTTEGGPPLRRILVAAAENAKRAAQQILDLRPRLARAHAPAAAAAGSSAASQGAPVTAPGRDDASMRPAGFAIKGCGGRGGGADAKAGALRGVPDGTESGGAGLLPPWLGQGSNGTIAVAGIGIDLRTPLGSGSFGRVYRGMWQGRSVAVKVLQYGSELCRAVHNEVLLSQTLRHPHVVASLHFVEVAPDGALVQRSAPLHHLPTQEQPQQSTPSDVTAGSGDAATRVVAPAASLPDLLQPFDSQSGDSLPRGLPVAAAAAAKDAAAHTQPAEGSSHGFLVMELCEGGTLEAWRRSRWREAGQLPDMDVIQRLALQIARGMAYIHSQSACHGDLKLSNVLLSVEPNCSHAGLFVPATAAASQGGGGLPVSMNSGPASAAAAAAAPAAAAVARLPGGAATCSPCEAAPGTRAMALCAKVGDFGLAQVLGADATHVSAQPHGTASHLAPEVWANGRISQPSDVYAFGITMWELATGERPWRDFMPGAILHRVVLGAGRPPLPLWLPPAYARLMVECWAQAPADRPTFVQVAQRLALMSC